MTIEERVANIERTLFDFTYEEAKSIYDSMQQTLQSLRDGQGHSVTYLGNNHDLFRKLERVLGIGIRLP